MALKARDLSVLTYANGFTHWHYTTPDNVAAVSAANYFNGAADQLRKFDRIMVTAENGGAGAVADLVVAKNVGGVVTVAAV